jgi:hypothetical protein
MKTQSVFSKTFLFLSLIAFTSLFVFNSCNKDDDNNMTSHTGMYTISGSSSGSQVVPTVTGSASGNISGTYNANTNLLSYNMTWNGLTGAATTTRLYTGASGTNGTLIGNTTITTAGATGASVGTMTLTDAQETALLNGTLYYVVTTSANTSGEIRGQITATAQ